MNELPVIALLHFYVGTIAVISGIGVMVAAKGRKLHRLSGKVFFYAMLMLCFSGFYLSYSRNLQFTFLLSALSLYLLLTGWYSASRKSTAISIADKLGCYFIISFGLGSLLLAVAGTGLDWSHPPTEPPYIGYLFFTAFAVRLSYSDIILLNSAHLNETARIKRHLARMCGAMLIATTVFFLGNNHVLPESLRKEEYLIVPVLFVVLFTLVWMIGFNHLRKSTQ